MAENEGEIDKLFKRMLEKGLVSTSHHWIEKAVEQKNPRLTLDLARSALLLYDRLDKRLVNLEKCD
jgi:hypothetical protein